MTPEDIIKIMKVISHSGSVGDVTFYKLNGKTVVRRKSGPSRKQAKHGEQFALSRRYSSEFGGRGRATKYILKALTPLRKVVNYNIAAALHRPLKTMQELDKSNALGERAIRFSRHPDLLLGLVLNADHKDRQIIETPTHFSIDSNGRATMEIPHLVPGVNLSTSGQNGYYRIGAVLSTIPDLHFTKKGYASPLHDLKTARYVRETTPWLPCTSEFPGHTFHLVPSVVPAGRDFIWMLTYGIEFGALATHGIVRQKGQGEGRVVMVRSGQS